MSGWVETGRNVVYPWLCDHLGHMNVKNYVGFFDISAFHLMSVLGLRSSDMHEVGETMVDAQHTIKYLVEQPAGSLVKIESAIIKIGTKSLTILHKMTNTETGDIAATMEVVLVYFDLKTRKSKEIPDTFRKKVAAHLVDEDSLD